MNRRPVLLLLAGLGLTTGLPLSTAFSAEDDEADVLYWVAPMNPNYRRDEPGKSPMGMDLVPVYADSAGDGDTVSIDPVMIQNLGVRTATVERGKLWRMINTVGYVAFDERKLSHLHLRTDGWIEKLYVKSDGVRVKKGDVLFELYSRELVNAQEEYIQSLRGSNDYLKLASRERLAALGMSPGQIKQVASKMRAFQKVRILASQDGVIDGLKVREGMYVKPATEVLTLADLSSIWLLVDVFERQSEWVAVGQPADVRLGYLPGRVWEGEVEFVYPTIDPKTRTLQARLRFDNPDEALKPDMYANVRIYAGSKDDVLTIPREALIKTGESQRVVIALGDGKFRAQDVTAGTESGDYVEIMEGLQEGDRVVTSGQFLIDSEASLRASISRMGDASTESSNTADSAQSITGMGTINEVFIESRSLNISHEPIADLDWPEMTMDFTVADTVDLNAVPVNEPIHFTLLKNDTGNWVIDNISRINGGMRE